jgi:beta-glucosidase
LESTLQNIVFHHLKLLLTAGVSTFMNSFNELNGIPATGNKYLQRQILKKRLEF